jgi:hypothetical protein
MATAGETASSKAVLFPPRCDETRPCARAWVEIADDDRLDPGIEDFRFGADVRLAQKQTDAGANIMQKGRYEAVGGQWKLQVDGERGLPSCVVQGAVDGERSTVRLVGDLSIADDLWHRVNCALVSDVLTLTIDDTAKSIGADVGPVRNTAGMRIGASGPELTDDQFHGSIDNVFFCLPVC